jgi:chromosome segregation ATPase
MVQNAVTQQFLKIKESMNQEVQRCVAALASKTKLCEEILQRLEGERSARNSIVGLRQEVDQQQSLINEMVQSRLGSTLPEFAMREREEEMTIIVENMRQDMEVIRSQFRNTLAGNAATSDQQQRVEKTCFELRRELESATAEYQRCKNAQTKMEGSLEELKLKIGDDNVKYQELTDMNRMMSDISQQLSDSRQQLSTQRERQQQQESDVTGLKTDLQSTTEDLRAVVSELKLRHDGFHTDHIDHKKKIEELGKSLQESRSSISEVRRASIEASDEAISSLRKQVEDGLAVKTEQQMLSASFGAELQARLADMEDNHRKISKDMEQPSVHHQELSKTVQFESAARVEMSQSIEAYRASHLQTGAEIRDAVSALQERVALLEAVQLEDRGLRERTMEQMERNLQDLMNVTQLERDARLQSASDSARRFEELEEVKRQLHVESATLVDLTQSLEVFRSAHLQSSSEMRKEIETVSQNIGSVSENCNTLRGFLDHYIEDLTRMMQEESAARLDFARVFDTHREEISARVGTVEEQLQETQQILDGVVAEEASMETLRAEYLSTRTELKAELDLAMDKLTQLESVCEDNDGRCTRVIEMLGQDIVILKKMVSDDTLRNETASLRTSLENVSVTVKAIVQDLEVERSRRVQEVTSLVNDVQALNLQTSQLEATSIARESTMVNLRTEVVDATSEVKPEVLRLKESVESLKAAIPRESYQLQSGMKVMQEKLTGLETAASEDRGWRQQAVQDLEGILGEMKHVSPSVTSTRTLPTLASALRQCKAELD